MPDAKRKAPAVAAMIAAIAGNVPLAGTGPKVCPACGKPAVLTVTVGGVDMCPSCAPVVEKHRATMAKTGKTRSAAKVARDLLRQTATTYLLRDVPDDLLRAFKQCALDRETNVRVLILDAMRGYDVSPAVRPVAKLARGEA